MKTIDKIIFNMAAGQYSGVMMTTKVMKKILKLTIKYQSDIRKILNENKDELYSSYWNLSYESGKQETVRYVIEGDNELDRRIELFKADKPTHIKELLSFKNHDEAMKYFYARREQE